MMIKNTIKMKMLLQLLFLCFGIKFSFISCAVNPIIRLPNGFIRGREDVSAQNRSFYAFEKIPYATPPNGKLRFQPPKPIQNWEGILDTMHLDVSCYQRSQFIEVPESEDCLYLNVFTPWLPEENASVYLPVMFFIHGGGFASDSSIIYGAEYFMDYEVIIVTFNYRLGPLGFLSTQDDVIPGNNGLKDQLLALKWTNDNIKLFGGDPDKITIFGQSAGSSSVAYHLLSPKSRGLFHGAICESGTALSPGAYQRRAKEIAFDTAAILNDTFNTNRDSIALLQFLQDAPIEELIEASNKYYNQTNQGTYYEILQGFFWAPVVEIENENSFLEDKMFGIVQGGHVNIVPLLIGTNSEEALPRNFDPEQLKVDVSTYDEYLDQLVPDDMQITDKAKRTEMGRLIREIYTGGEPFVDHLGDAIRMVSDNSMTRPIIKFAELFSKFSKTYFYQFSYDGEAGGINTHYDGAENVAHSEELRYIICFIHICNINQYPEADQLTHKRLMKIWTDFAKHLNPTPEPSELLKNITWPLVSTEQGDFLYVDINENLEIKNHPKEQTYAKWVQLYDSLGYNDFDTY